jgi:predicted nucleotidyltransferase
LIRTDFRRILSILLDHDVEFILVGALSAVFQGAPAMTVDVDIVHLRDDRNIASLLNALSQLDAYFRGHGDKRLQVTAAHLVGNGHQLLSTNFGPLDLLGAIEHGLTYDDLLQDSIEVDLDGRPLRVLSIAKYLELKESSRRAKDQARLPMLRETLKMKKNSE